MRNLVAAALAVLLTAAGLAVAAPASAEPGPARQISWSSHRGVDLGDTLRSAARRLGTGIQTVPCAGQDFVYTGRTGDGVFLSEGGRDNDRVNDLSTNDRRVVGPWGIRVGTPVRTVETKADRHDRRLWRKDVRNPYYGTTVRWAWVVGPGGHVLHLTRENGRVRSMSVMTDVRLARKQRESTVDC